MSSIFSFHCCEHVWKASKICPGLYGLGIVFLFLLQELPKTLPSKHTILVPRLGEWKPESSTYWQKRCWKAPPKTLRTCFGVATTPFEETQQPEAETSVPDPATRCDVLSGLWPSPQKKQASKPTGLMRGAFWCLTPDCNRSAPAVRARSAAFRILGRDHF